MNSAGRIIMAIVREASTYTMDELGDPVPEDRAFELLVSTVSGAFEGGLVRLDQGLGAVVMSVGKHMAYIPLESITSVVVTWL